MTREQRKRIRRVTVYAAVGLLAVWAAVALCVLVYADGVQAAPAAEAAAEAAQEVAQEAACGRVRYGDGGDALTLGLAVIGSLTVSAGFMAILERLEGRR